MVRRAAKVDGNQADIVRALLELGFGILNLSRVGDGCPDLLVCHRHQETGVEMNVLVEVKTARGKLRPGQEEFIETWRGPVVVARSLSDVLRAFGWSEEQLAWVEAA